jgi:putative NADPH-quinone reductase
MKRINLLFAHPAPDRSRLNKAMADEAAGLDGVSVRDLYELYPNMYIDTDTERTALLEADVVIFQFPVYWFSAPALLKEWQDMVLTSGFAFGPGGHALHGKKFMLAVSTGGQASSYAETRPHGAPLSTFLRPFEQTARFCGMTLLEPFVANGVGAMDSAEIAGTVQAYRHRLIKLTGSSTDG